MKRQTAVTTNAFGRNKETQYASDSQAAIFEMAEIVGLKDVPLNQRQPPRLSTRRVGEPIRQLLRQGVRHTIIDVGGSSINDGDIGMAEGPGYALYDQDNQKVEALGEDLGRIAIVDKADVPTELIKTKVIVITDVINLLCGKEDASFVFEPQKGSKENELAVADQAIHDFYMRSASQVIEASGSSAGGGMGAGLLAFASGKIVSGTDYVLDLLEFDKRVQQADLIVVGERCLDGQSLKGKAPVGIAKGVPEGVPVITICGSVGKGSEKAADVGISTIFPILPVAMPLQEALQ